MSDYANEYAETLQKLIDQKVEVKLSEYVYLSTQLTAVVKLYNDETNFDKKKVLYYQILGLLKGLENEVDMLEKDAAAALSSVAYKEAALKMSGVVKSQEDDIFGMPAKKKSRFEN